MKVFNLCCELAHAFEGWFASAEAYDQQLAQGLIECPICASTQIRKLPSAPRLNLGAGSADTAPSAVPAGPDPRELQALWMKMARFISENTENVGDRFAEEARRIHYNEAPERAIRGQTSSEQARELVEEGIDVISFPMPKLPEGPVQ